MSMTMNDDWGESDSERQVRLGREKKIESLQAEIRKKDQEIADQKEDIVHYKAALEVSDDQYRENQEQLMAKDARIKDLEQQLAKQQAYIGRLEATYVEMVFSATGSDEEAK